MNFIRQAKIYKVKKHYLTFFLRTYWFIPSDVLQRSMEANIWDLCTFKSPVLDIGIGNGTLSKFLFKNHSPMTVGIDIEKAGLDKARATKKYKKVLYVNAEKMIFKDNSFHTIVSNSTFEHIQHDLKAVSEVARVLKKDGLFFFTVPSNFLQKWILEYEQDKNKTTAKKNLVSFNKRTQHLHYHSYEEWKKYLQKNKLEIVFYKYYFPKNIALFWYKLFTLYTLKINHREFWSYLGHSVITKFLPKKIIIAIMENFILKNSYANGFFLESEPGAQLFIVAKKIN